MTPNPTPAVAVAQPSIVRKALEAAQEVVDGVPQWHNAGYAARLIKKALMELDAPPTGAGEPTEPSPVRIENDDDFCEAASHCLMSSEMDLRHQGMALRDFALPALEYARFKLLCAAVQPIKTPGVSVTIPKALVDNRYHIAAGPGEQPSEAPFALAWFYPDGKPYTLTWASEDAFRVQGGSIKFYSEPLFRATPAIAVAAVDGLHNRIMNLRSPPWLSNGDNPGQAFRQGHKIARHAAAELIAGFASALNPRRGLEVATDGREASPELVDSLIAQHLGSGTRENLRAMVRAALALSPRAGTLGETP